jgi:hypothetical protein
MTRRPFTKFILPFGALCLALVLGATPAMAADRCADLALGNATAMHAALKAALVSAIAEDNGGLNNHM